MLRRAEVVQALMALDRLIELIEEERLDARPSERDHLQGAASALRALCGLRRRR